jgi:hypothetical protein
MAKTNMKKLLFAALTLLTTTLSATAQNTPTSQMEHLDRGLVVVPSGSQRILSWRLLGTDDEDARTDNCLTRVVHHRTGNRLRLLHVLHGCTDRAHPGRGH